MPDFPRMATAAEIWNYSTRELTAFLGKPREHLVGVDETIHTRLDTTLSTRSSHTADDVWTAFEASTGTRATRIDRLADVEAWEAAIEGSISFLATGTYPSTVTLVESTLGVKHTVEGFIDLSELASGESLKVRELMSIVTPVDYKLYAEETYSDAQALPQLYIQMKPAKYGLKLELAMDAAPAADRTFRYQLFRKKVA